MEIKNELAHTQKDLTEAKKAHQNVCNRNPANNKTSYYTVSMRESHDTSCKLRRHAWNISVISVPDPPPVRVCYQH